MLVIRLVLGRAPAADDVGAGGGGADLLGVAVGAAVGGVDVLALVGRAGGIPRRDVGAALVLDGRQMAELDPRQDDQAEPGEEEDRRGCRKKEACGKRREFMRRPPSCRLGRTVAS